LLSRWLIKPVDTSSIEPVLPRLARCLMYQLVLSAI